MSMIEPVEDTHGFPFTEGATKFEIIPTDAADPSSATFVVHDEDHTLGNSLRFMVMKNPAVSFCGYSIPHPSEFKIHMRIQTDGSITAAQALNQGLDDLVALSEHVLATFEAKVAAKGDYETRDI
ncbi:RNA polymerase subunit AC19 [Geranomyces variabilis]|uniref:DNA-directed RNA polymerases I and III subunit RPAC2 n=1 Tax=Geranomyces variabilis TaxID=109894 RepID=A0AAD5TPK8_9FUNG|nr:RNA polymerase subunit AC19 [Geranomyces variabilis]